MYKTILYYSFIEFIDCVHINTYYSNKKKSIEPLNRDLDAVFTLMIRNILKKINAYKNLFYYKL